MNERLTNQFVVGDARELEALLASPTCVDTIISSPPYLDLKDYGHQGQIGFGQTEEAYYKALEDIFRQALNVTRDTGAFWLILDTVRTDKELLPLPWLLVERALRVGWTLQETIIWDKGKGSPFSRQGSLRNLFEYCFLLTKRRDGFKWRSRRLSELHRPQSSYFVGWPERHSPFGRNPGNIWRLPITVQGVWSPTVRSGNSHRQHLHQCPFPFALVERLIDLTTDPGDLVLDMFAGSGTVAAVADATDRRWVAIEINPDYKRIFEEEVLRAATQHYEAGYWRRKLLTNELVEEGILNLKLRHLKFIRELTRHTTKALKTKFAARADAGIRAILGICRTDLRAVLDNRDYYHQSDSKPLIEIDVYFALSDPNLCETVRGMANEFARRRPLSKYGIEASIHAHPEGELDLHTLALSPDDLLYIYEDLRAHRYTKILAAGRWKTALRRKHKAASSPPLLANNAVLLPGRYTSNLLDMSAVVAKRRVIRYALKRHGNNLEQAAIGLGVNLYTLLKEIRLLHLRLPADIPEEQRALVTAANLINPAAWGADAGDEGFDEATLEETDTGASRIAP